MIHLARLRVIPGPRPDRTFAGIAQKVALLKFTPPGRNEIRVMVAASFRFHDLGFTLSQMGDILDRYCWGERSVKNTMANIVSNRSIDVWGLATCNKDRCARSYPNSPQDVRRLP
jgi:hypothetical protein